MPATNHVQKFACLLRALTVACLKFACQLCDLTMQYLHLHQGEPFHRYCYWYIAAQADIQHMSTALLLCHMLGMPSAGWHPAPGSRGSSGFWTKGKFVRGTTITHESQHGKDESNLNTGSNRLDFNLCMRPSQNLPIEWARRICIVHHW